MQWKCYMLYAIFNFCFIPIIWWYYIETANLSLEQVDRLFEIKHDAGNDMSWSEATRLAHMEREVAFSNYPEKDHGNIEHCEVVA
jgi:hypothetical protein